MMNNVPVFLDTNILIRYDIIETPEHQQIRQAITSLIHENCTLWINRQVIREYCRVLTHPSFNRPLKMPQAVARARKLIPYFKIADENQEVTNNLLNLLDTVPIGGKQVHDANIVATMQMAHIQYLVTLNVSDFRRFSDYITLVSVNDLI